MKTSSPVRIVDSEVPITAETSLPVRTLDDEFVDVFVQDQTTSLFQYFLMNNQKTGITLTSPIAIGDTVINVSAGHGFTAGGEYIAGTGDSTFFQQRVVSVAVNAITIGAPILVPFPIAGTRIIRGDIEMDVNGSITPVTYRCSVSGITPVDIDTVLVTMQHPAASDDSLFGDLAALTNGLLIQKIGDTPIQPISIAMRSNQDFREFGAEIEYTQKAGGGNFSTNITFDLRKLYGVVVRLDPRNNDCLDGIVRDNISALIRLRVSVIGQFTLGE